MLPRFGAEVENAENDGPPVTTGLIVHYFRLLSLRRISIILFFRCGSLIPVVVAWHG